MEGTQETNEKNYHFSLIGIYVAFSRAHLIADWEQPDIAPSKVALADYSGLIEGGTTITQAHLLQATT